MGFLFWFDNTIMPTMTMILDNIIILSYCSIVADMVTSIIMIEVRLLGFRWRYRFGVGSIVVVDLFVH